MIINHKEPRLSHLKNGPTDSLFHVLGVLWGWDEVPADPPGMCLDLNGNHSAQ